MWIGIYNNEKLHLVSMMAQESIEGYVAAEHIDSILKELSNKMISMAEKKVGSSQ